MTAPKHCRNGWTHCHVGKGEGCSCPCKGCRGAHEVAKAKADARRVERERADAREALLGAEHFYLRVNGWSDTYDEQNLLGERVRWSHRELKKFFLSQGHAVNAQKQIDARARKFVDKD